MTEQKIDPLEAEAKAAAEKQYPHSKRYASEDGYPRTAPINRYEGFIEGYIAGANREAAPAIEAGLKPDTRYVVRVNGGEPVTAHTAPAAEREALAYAIRKGSGASRYQAELLADQMLPHLRHPQPTEGEPTGYPRCLNCGEYIISGQLKAHYVGRGDVHQDCKRPYGQGGER